MTFNSFIFILVYLPLLLIGWYGLNHLRRYTLANLYLIAMSFWFYGMFGRDAVYMLLLSIVLNYAASQGIELARTKSVSRTNVGGMTASTESGAAPRTETDATGARRAAPRTETDATGARRAAPSARGPWLVAAVGIILNLLLLASLKYSYTPGFLAGILPGAMQVGFSFYTFSQISFLVDRARGEVPQDGFLNYLTWVTYFPKLVEGPIVRYTELASQLAAAPRDPSDVARFEARRRLNAERFTRGLILFVLGMGKKVLLADHLAAVADYGFTAMYTDTITTIAAVLAYALQLYLDFSGFCDMAMGVGWMMNIELPVNFDSPFKVTDFSAFWSKWHMTLTRFLTTYVYIPLGGSRRGKTRAILNVLIVFILSGIWHGEEPHYIAWGLLTGILVVLYNQFLRGRTRGNERQIAGAASSTSATTCVRTALQRVVVMILFCVTLFFFRCETVENAFIMLRYLFRPLFPGWITTAASQISYDELYVIEKAVQILAPGMLPYLKLAEFLVLLLVSLLLVYGRRNARELAETCQLTPRNAAIVALLLVWCMLSFSGVSTFLYFKY